MAGTGFERTVKAETRFERTGMPKKIAETAKLLERSKRYGVELYEPSGRYTVYEMDERGQLGADIATLEENGFVRIDYSEIIQPEFGLDQEAMWSLFGLRKYCDNVRIPVAEEIDRDIRSKVEEISKEIGRILRRAITR